MACNGTGLGMQQVQILSKTGLSQIPHTYHRPETTGGTLHAVTLPSWWLIADRSQKLLDKIKFAIHKAQTYYRLQIN